MDGHDRARAETRSSGLPAGVAVFLPMLVAIAVGLPCIKGSFIRDDWDYIGGNPHVACPASLSTIFKSSFQPLKPLGLYRPVTTLSLRLDACLGGEERPWIFHATNLLLAAAAAGLVALLARNLVGRSGDHAVNRSGGGPSGPPASAGSVLRTAVFWPAKAGGPGGAVDRMRSGDREASLRAALAAGLLFAAHPARTEAVCWISGRAENLMTFWALLCLVLASGPERVWRMIAAAICAALAAWSKEQGFALVLLVPIVAPPTSGKRLVQAVVMLGALGLAFILRWGVLGGIQLRPGLPPFEDLTFPDRIAQGLRLLLEYARITVWPRPLLFEYDANALRVPGFGDLRVLLGGLLLIALAIPLFFARSRPLLAAAAGLFLLPLVPVLHVIVPIGEDFAERFLALPIAGAALLVGGLAARYRVAGFAIAMLLVAVCGAAFTVRAADYKSERILYEATVARAPQGVGARTLLAASLLAPDGGTRRADPRDFARAEALLREAVAADPLYLPARSTIASVGAQQRAAAGRRPLPADIEFLMETARLFPKIPQSHGMLGMALYQHGEVHLARPSLERELENMPLDLVAASTLARILDEQKDPAGAQKVIDAVRAQWEGLWRRFPGFAPVVIMYARTLADGGRDTGRARTVLREGAKAACRPSDRREIEQALAETGGK